MCQTRVSSTRNATFASGNTLGRVFGGTKKPCGNGDTHSLGFPHKNIVLGYIKTLGRAFWGIKSPCGNGDTHSLGFPHKINVFSYGKNPGACFLGHKTPLREWGHALPGFGQVPVSSPGLEPDDSGVCRPRASPLGNLTTVGRPRARPLGNLTTVGHLAKVSPDLSPHFQTQKPHFLTSFQRRKIEFSDA